jgi:predicted metal-dependent peptidase
MNAIEKLKKAKITLLIEQPWFGQLVTYLNFISAAKIGSEDTQCETMGVDIKGNVFYNENFIERLSIKELKTVLCHEILHLVFLHPNRCGNRQPMLYNIAADLKVNNELAYVRDNNDDLLFKLPAGCLMPHGNTFENQGIVVENISEKTTEMIYNELLQQAFDPKNKMFDVLVVGSGEEEKPTGTNQHQNGIAQAEKQWKERAYVANASCKDKGSIPLGVLREYEMLDNAELDWKKVIRQRLRNIYKKVSWSTIRKKYFPDFYFPGIKKVPGLTCVIGIDTSGSMGKKELNKAMSEIWSLSRQYEKISFFVVPCDAEIEQVIPVNTANKRKLFNIKLDGGGGTSFIPVFDLIKEKYNNKIDCLIYFTDLYGDFPEESGRFNTYWITTTENIDVPFGRVIHIKED